MNVTQLIRYKNATKESILFNYRFDLYFSYDKQKIAMLFIEKYISRIIQTVILLNQMLFLCFKNLGISKQQKDSNSKSEYSLIYSLPQEQLDPLDSNSIQILLKNLSDPEFSLKNIEHTNVLIEMRSLPFRKIIRTADCYIGKDMNLLLFHAIPSSRAKVKILFLCYKRFFKILLLPSQQLKIGLAIRDYVISDILWKGIYRFNTLHLITTQTNLQLLPYNFYDEKLEKLSPLKTMFWYSANNTIISKNQIPFSISQDKLLMNLPIDQHYVWTEWEAKRLHRNGINAKAVGPIIFNQYRKSTVIRYNCEAQRHKLIIYDISPRINSSNIIFYTNANLISFLSEILEVSELVFGNSVEILVKNKRNLTSKSQRIRRGEYYDYLVNLATAKKINLIDARKRLEDLAGSSCLSISIPFVSPPIYTSSIGIQSCYYIPEKCQDFFQKAYDPNIKCFIGKSELRFWLEEHKLKKITN
jgi:hypothetical protein